MNNNNHEKDYNILTDKVDSIIEKCETEMTNLIEKYNDKYEDSNDAAYIETTDLSNLFTQLSEYIEDHQ